MWNLFRRIPCRCTSCNKTRYIPRRRILRIERFFHIKKGQPFVWTCLDCHQGIVVPGNYINSHDETVSLEPDNLPKDLIVIQL